MIGSPENDAALRLECWKIAVTMAGGGRFDVNIVDKTATAVYSFIANGSVSPETPPVTEGRDKSTKTPKR